MIRPLLSLLLLLLVVRADAQVFGNEWINYSQKYYRIKVWNDGVYRIPWTALSTAIPELAGTDPRNVQLFGRGQEQFIHVEGEADGTWNDGDYIEFFGRKNDGWLDARLYANPASEQSNPYYSMFTDTAVYFLTWNTSLSNRRFSNETDQNFTAYTAAPYFTQEIVSQQTGTYYFGKTDFNNSTDPEYTEGEGWSGDVFTAPIINQITQLPSPNGVSTGPAAELQVTYKSVSNAPWFGDHRYKLRLGTQPQIDSTFEGHGSRRFTLSMPASGLGAATTPYRFTYDDTTNNAGQLVTSNSVFSNYRWRYPHNFNLENKTFFRMRIPNNAAAEKYLLNMTNLANASGGALLWDLTNGYRIAVVNQSNVLKAVLPNGTIADRECYITTTSQVVTLSDAAIRPIDYNPAQPGRFTDYTALGGVDFVLVTHRSLSSEAQAYKAYRSTRYSTEVFYIDELIDQFAYGIQQHPLSIRGFADAALAYWTNKPEFLYLLGKSISAHHLRNDAEAWSQCLVPTFGYPSSDILFTAGLAQTLPYEPALATGRLSATSGADVTAYLNKVQEYESATPDLWMKQVLHFGGGTSQGEQQTYLNYLNTYEQTIEDTLFGGTVYTYQKTTSAPIEQSQSAIITDYINNGVSLMTFFGHATGNGFDVSIDEPTAYNNQGKYPFLIGNSCYAGDIHQPPGLGFSKSEEFMLVPNRGTIGFIASVALGIPNQLHTYTDTLYRYFGQRHYGEPMGMNMKRTCRAVYSTDPFRKAVILETTLHGDPAVVLNSHLKPDYRITAQDVFFEPSEVTTELDSFTVNIRIANVGRAIQEPLGVEIIRNFPNTGLSTTYNKLVENVYYEKTLSFKMPVTDLVKGGVGINSITVRLDPLNQFDELSENNNIVNAQLIIRSAEVIPVWPYEFALVPENSITLKASTGDPFAPVRNYVFEIDTTDTFNSPFKQSTTFAHAGGVLEWTPSFALQDSMVYFWRVSPDSLPGSSWKWKESSFQYIPGKRGWSQDHFFQFKKNTYNQLDYLRAQRMFDFVINAKALTCYAFGYPQFPDHIDELWNTSYKIDAEVWADAGCSLDGAMYIAVIDSVQLLPWMSPQNCWDVGNQFGQFNNTCQCKNGSRMANFVFRNENSATEMAAMRDMLNSVPNGNYILAYTWIYGNFQNWDASVHQAFQNLGADSTQFLPNEYPYIFFVKKGHPETAIELIADSANGDLVLNAQMFNSWVSGDFTSTLIGPGSGWDTLSWKARNFDSPTDSIRIQVRGVKADGTEDVVTEAVVGASGDYNLNPDIGTASYVYLKLNAFMRDDSLRTPVQLDRWQVTYDPVPECALNPVAGLYLYNDTLQQGDSLRLAIAIQNISAYAMDSMLVAYWVMDADRNIYPVQYNRQKPLQPGEILLDTVSVSSLPYAGLNSIWVEANPNQDQPEQFRFNNIGSLNFFVTGDKINPLLDVTFDGVHILNGDIISPKPEVLIQLKDENPYLALDDTASFQLFLKAPTQNTATPVYFRNNTVLEFIPGSLPANKARLEWRPVFIEDGVYEFVVKARDRSNNASASVQYSIRFEVINKSTITQVLNYPNPFSTRTHFVFTLTGSEIPEDFRIQIMTITGKVVREIRKEELGPIRIGRNMTEFAWDGRDEFGDLLANGTYLYRVWTSIDGAQIERRQTNADGYFDRGLGKMVLIR
jgi:hypothetical protein